MLIKPVVAYKVLVTFKVIRIPFEYVADLSILPEDEHILI